MDISISKEEVKDMHDFLHVQRKRMMIFFLILVYNELWELKIILKSKVGYRVGFKLGADGIMCNKIGYGLGEGAWY